MLKERFKRLQGRLLAEAKAFYGKDLVSFVVFGSAARGTYRFDSDLDILIIAENLPRGRMKRIGEFANVEQRLEPFLRTLRKEGVYPEISAIIKTPEEAQRGSPLFLDMVEDALILYDRSRFFARLLDQLRKRLRQLGAKRIWAGNVWHGVLKPDYRPGEIIEL